ncbi:GIY-YIG nuclease family protein [Sphingomonas bacterium]|uniref:GIY-YIG nuclease family protein n=1 Tax=Sphingomonas bacterium TaxID=1895847 RepID=UPI001576EA54|nr:GIY-YIG nuclease family protein [Sphingomonas bacterium]
MTFWAYVLRCADDSYYTGHTDALEASIGAHQSGELPGYTQRRRPVTLAWSQEFPTRLEALEAERRIKGWSRARKEALFREDRAAIHALATPPSERALRLRSGRTDEDNEALPTSVRAEPSRSTSPPPP